MLIRFVGPMPRGHGFQVHAVGCRDIGRDEDACGRAGWSSDVTCKRTATLEVYSDAIAEGSSDYDTCRDDLHFNPCCESLPESVEENEGNA